MPPKSHLRHAIEGFLATLPHDAPLRRVMADNSIVSRLLDFDQADAIAIAKQGQYRRAGRVALWTMTISVVIGALALMPLDQWLAGRLGQVVTSAQTIALAIAVLAVVWIAWRQPVDQWMKARAKAEAIRADVSEPSSELDYPVAIRFDCFRRSLPARESTYRSQLHFFADKSALARNACGRATPLRLVGYLLTAFAVLFGVAALVKGWTEFGLPMWRPLIEAAEWLLIPNANRWQLGLGTVASSVLAFASARSLMDQDERNATCYRVAAEQIQEVVDSDFAAAEAAAAKGDDKAVQVFTVRIQKILEAENLAWIYSRPPDDPWLGV